ncbi:hypothetical protein [Sorangium sp. So ce1099]|uniref:hypothetical protein n=1 Tax=Sorangium sp. So ce1099 TaxID=3133331 RepID=UPI003F5DE5E3
MISSAYLATRRNVRDLSCLLALLVKDEVTKTSSATGRIRAIWCGLEAARRHASRCPLRSARAAC